jgi:hypothetical protein
MSNWRAMQEDKNRRSLARLHKALPPIFPTPVLINALARAWTPAMPRRAVDLYWRAHPIRADKLARALAARSGAPPGWRWDIDAERADERAASFRLPPTPYREPRYARGPGFCCICGQPVYRFGWHVDLWDRGANRNAAWHAACVVAWDLWTGPSDYAALLRRLQRRRCTETGGRLWKAAQIDHRVPLFRVWREHRELPWPILLGFWGITNLQVINRDAHVVKCAAEAGSRRRRAASPDRITLP